MRLRNCITAGWILGACSLAVAPVAAGYRDHASGPRLARQLVFATDRLHDMGDGDLRHRGRYGRDMAETLHEMDTWAGYYEKAVQKRGFRSDMARKRFDRFLVEYREACAFLHRGSRREAALLHSTVAQLSAAYGRDVAWGRDFREEDWEHRARRR
jgi:hypothetical protein